MAPAPLWMRPGWLPGFELIEWPSLDAMREEHERLLASFLADTSEVRKGDRLLELGEHVARCTRQLSEALHHQGEGELAEGIRAARVAAGHPPESPPSDEKPTITSEERLQQASVYAQERRALTRDFEALDRIRFVVLSGEGVNVLVEVEQLQSGLSGDSSAQAFAGMAA